MDLPDFVGGTMEGYLRLFSNYGALGTAQVGAALFILLRIKGVLRDTDFAAPRATWLIWCGGIAGLFLIAFNFMAQNIILTYHVSVIDPESNPSACVSPAHVEEFFVECTRWKLKFFATISPVVALAGVGIFALWFSRQPNGGKQRDKENATPIFGDSNDNAGAKPGDG